jgi:choline kinase
MLDQLIKGGLVIDGTGSAGRIADVGIRDGRIVDFHKRPTEAHDWHGESVGFFRLAPAEMGKILATAGRLIADGGASLEYEEAIRLAMQADPDRFGFADVSGLPWTEIDFPEDVEKANHLLSDLANAPAPTGAKALSFT